jgi:hypothetical protein
MICRILTSLLAFIITYCYSQSSDFSNPLALSESIPLSSEIKLVYLYQDVILERWRNNYYKKIMNDNTELKPVKDLRNRLMIDLYNKSAIIDINDSNINVIDTVVIAYACDAKGRIARSYKGFKGKTDRHKYGTLPNQLDYTAILGKYLYTDTNSSISADYYKAYWLGREFYKQFSNQQPSSSYFNNKTNIVNRGIRIYSPSEPYKDSDNSICLGYTFPAIGSYSNIKAQFNSSLPAQDVGYDINSYDSSIIMHVTHSANEVIKNNPDRIAASSSHNICYSGLLFGYGRFGTVINRGAIAMIRSGDALNDKKLVVASVYIVHDIEEIKELINAKNAYIGVKRTDSKPLTDNDIAIFQFLPSSNNNPLNLINYGLIEGNICLLTNSHWDPFSTISNHGIINSNYIKITGLHDSNYKQQPYAVYNVENATITTKMLEARSVYNGGYLKIDDCKISHLFVNSGTLEISSNSYNYLTNISPHYNSSTTGTLIQNEIYLEYDSILNFGSIISKNFFINVFINYGNEYSTRIGDNLISKHNFKTDSISYISTAPKVNRNTYNTAITYIFKNTGVATITKKIDVNFCNDGDLYLGDKVDTSYRNTFENKKNIYVNGLFNLYGNSFKSQPNSLLLANNIKIKRKGFINKGQIKTKPSGMIELHYTDYINDEMGEINTDELQLDNLSTKFYNKGCLKATTIYSDSKYNSLENTGKLHSCCGINVNINNTGYFYIDSKQASKISNSRRQNNPGASSEYFNKIENKAGKIGFILTELQSPKNISYPLLSCNLLSLNNHSKIILEQSSSCYAPVILLRNVGQSKKVTILTADSIIGKDITNRLFRENYLFYVKDVTNKQFILKVDNISFATKGNKQEVSATLGWHAVSKASDFPKLDADNCYSSRDIGVYFGAAIYGFNIIEQDKQDLFYLRQQQAFIGKTTSSSPATMITIDSSKPNNNNPAIIVEISKTLNVKQISIEATIDATIDANTNSTVDNIAVKFCPNKSITDNINAIDGSLRYHALMPKLELTGAVINNALIQGKYGINIALPLQGNLKNNSKIIGKTAAIKFDGPANIILGNLENYGLIKSNNYAILMDSQVAHYATFNEYIKTKKQYNVLPITNRGTIDGNIVSSGNIYLVNKSLIMSATIEHIYGALNLDNTVSSNLNIKEIINASNSTVVINNSGSFQSDNIQINELHNNISGSIKVNNLSLDTKFYNEGSITANDLQLNEVTLTNSNSARLIVNILSQVAGIIENNNNSYLDISTIKTITKNTSKKNSYQNKNNSILKINNSFNSQVLSVDNNNSCLDINNNSNFNKYESTSGVLKVLIPDNPNDITSAPLIKINTEALFTSKSANSSRFALYAKNPTILPHAVTVTLLEAHNIRGDDIKKHVEQMHTFLAGVDLNLGSTASRDIIIISNPVLNTSVTPNKLQAQIRWWKIIGGFPKLDNFNTYNMEEALLSYLPFIEGLKVIEYDHNKNWYIAKREVVLGKKFTNDSAKNIFASTNPVNKQAVTIEVDQPIAIRKILVQGTIDANSYTVFTNNKNYTANQCGLLITGKELSVTEGIYIEAKHSLISSLSSTLNPALVYKTAAMLLETSITANIYNYGEISGLTGIGITGNANLLNGTITNYNKINVVGDLIYSLPIKQQVKSKRKFAFYNEQSATVIAGGCMLSGNNINIINKGLLQITTLTHSNAISTLKNNQDAVFDLTTSQNISSIVTMINYGLLRSSNRLSFTSLQNTTNASITANILNLIEDSSNSGTISINKLENNKIFDNSINAMLIVTGTKGLYLKDSKFINKGDIKVINSIYLDGKFTNQGNIYTGSVVDNNNKLINKKFIRITGKNGLSLTSNIDNRGYMIVDATLSVIANYNSQGNWLVGGFNANAQFTNKSGYNLKIATNDLVIKTPRDIVNQGTLEVVKSIKLASNFANNGILIAATLEGVIANIPELNNNGSNYAHINVVKDIIINNYASLTVNNAIKGNVTLRYNNATLGNVVTQSGQLMAADINTKGKLIIRGKANITNNLIANVIEVASTTAIPTKLQVKNLTVADKLINYSSIEANSIKLPMQTEQYGKLSVTGASGLHMDNQINNYGEINITNGLYIDTEVKLAGVINAKFLTASTGCNCILTKQATVNLANIGDINKSNQIIKIINYGELNLANHIGNVTLLGDITIHNDTDYNSDGEVLIHSDVQQFANLQVGKVSASRPINYTLQQNAIAQFTEPIQQPNISLINSGNLDLQPNSSFKSHTYHNNGTITVNVTDFINSSTKTPLLTLDDLILNQQKTNNKFILKPVLSSSILDTSYINQPQTLYLLHINNNVFYLDNNNQQHIIDRIQTDINNYINLTSDSIHGVSFSINSKIKSAVVSSSQALQSGARYLYVTIAPTLTYKFTDKNMGFNQQTLQVAELGKHCLKQNSNVWGVCWRYNKSSTALYDNNLIISPYYVITENNLVSYKNNNLVIGTTKHKTVYAEAANLPAFIIGSKIDNAATPPAKQLIINNISFANIQVTGRDIIYPRHDVTNRDGVLIAGNNSIKISDKINIDHNTSFIAGYDKHAFHIATGIIGNIANAGNIGDMNSGYGIYISSAVSLTIANNNTIEGMLAALMLEPAPYWRHQKTDLIINNNKNIKGSILIVAATQQANTTINNIAAINSDKIVNYSGSLNINNNNTGTIIVNEISATNIINKGNLKINTDNKFVVNKIANTGDLYIKDMVLANNYICSGTLNATNFDGKGYKLDNSGINKLANIKNVIIDKYQLLEIQESISGNVSILADLTLGSNINIANNTNLILSGQINYNKYYLTNYGSLTITSNKFVLSEYFLNERNANLNIANILQTKGSVTIGGNVHATALQPITTGSITIGKNSTLRLEVLDNSTNKSVLDFYIQGTLDVNRKTSFAIISGNINIANDNQASGLLLNGKLQQNKGVLTIDNINTLNNAILEVTDTKFTKIINNNKLAIENNNKLQIPSGSSIESYTPAANSQLVIPIKQYFHLINYPLLHTTNNFAFNKTAKIKIILDDNVILPIQHRTRVKIISSDRLLLTANKAPLQLADVQNIFSQLSINHRLIKVIKDSISIEDNGHSLVADIELIDSSSLPSGMYEVEIPLSQKFLGKCQQQDTNITGVALTSLASNYIAIAPYFMAVYSKKIAFAKNQLTVGTTTSNNTIKVEDYKSPALVISIQATPSSITMSTPVAIDINIVNQDINGYQFAYRNTLGEKANQDGLLITRNNNTIQLQTKINIDKDSILAAGENNHALHIAVPITGEIENSGTIGLPNTGVGVHFSQLMAGTLTNNNIIQGKLAAINIELDSATNNKIAIVNNSGIKGSIIIQPSVHISKTPVINIHNQKNAYIVADAIKADTTSELNLINNKGAVVRVNNLAITNATNDGIIAIAESALQYNNFNNRSKLYLTDLIIDIKNNFINDGIVASTGMIMLNKNYICNGTITGNNLIGNNYHLQLPYASFATLNDVEIKADVISVSSLIKNDVIIEDTLTVSGNVTQVGNLTAKDIIGADTFIIGGITSVTNKLTLNSLYVNNSASLTAATIECKQIFDNSGVTVVNDLINTKAKIVQAGILKILGANTVTLNSNFHQYGTTEITKATVKVANDIVVQGHLVLKNLLADYKLTNNFIKVDINKNSAISIKENIGDINKLDKKIIFINDGSLILSNNSSINGNIEIYNKYYSPELPATGIVQIKGNITQQGKLSLGKFVSNNNSEITIQPNSIVKCNSAMQQNVISIVNNGTLEIAQGSSLNEYTSNPNSCLVLALNNIENIKSATNSALQLKQQAVFNTNSIIKLKPQTRIIPQFANNQIYLINTTKGIVDANGNKITNIQSLVKSIDTESTLLKITKISLVNNRSLVANLQVNRIFPDANMQSADMQLLHSLLGSCQPKDELIEAACWNYNKNKTNNMLISPDILALDKVAIYDDANSEFIVDSKNVNQYRTIYADNKPAICIGTTISSNKLASNAVDDISLANIQFNNLNINAGKNNPLLNAVTKTSNEDGIVITGINPIVLYNEMLISDTVKIESGIDRHALHLAVPMVGTINNHGSIGSKTSGYGLAITQILQGEFNNFNLIAGDKAAIIIKPMTSSSGKALTIVNEGTIIGSIILEATTNIDYPNITLKNSANIQGKDLSTDNNLEFTIINTASGTINVNNLHAQKITNTGKINTFEFDVYYISNYGEITVTNSMNLYADTTNNGSINANIIDGRGYQLTSANNILTASILKNISIYNNLPVNLQDRITGDVYIKNKLQINKKYNAIIYASSTLQVGSIKIDGKLENNGELIVVNNDLECSGTLLNNKHALVDTKNYNIVLAATLTNNGSITTNNILGASCTVINNSGAILSLQNLGGSKQAITINNSGIIDLNKQLKVSVNNDGIIDGNIYINKSDIKRHNGELNIYTDVYQQSQSNLYLGKINCINKTNFYIAEHAKTVIANRINQHKLSIANKGSITLQPLSIIDKYSGDSISTLVLPITSYLGSYGDNYLLTIEDDCLFNSGAKLLLNLSELLQKSILLQQAKINLLKIKKSITYNKNTITKEEIKDIIDFNHEKLIIALDKNDIQINKDNKDYTLVSINITATGALPHGFSYGYIFLDKTILGECQSKNEKIPCFFHKDNLDSHGSPTACNLGIYPSFAVIEPARVTINKGNIQIGSPTSNVREYIAEYTGNHPALVLATNIEAEGITDYTNDTLEFNSLKISNISITGQHSDNSTVKLQPQDGLLITGANPLKVNNGIQIATDTNILAGKNKHALHLAAPIVAKITNFGVIGDSVNDSGVKISNILQGEIINLGNISASNTAISIDVDASYLVNMRDMLLTNKKQINGSIIATVKNSALTESIIKSASLTAINHATITLKNYAQISSCYKLIDNDLLSMQIINQGGKISANNIAVKLIDNYGIIQNVATLDLVNNSFINNDSATLKLISGSSITIANNFINNGEVDAFNISLGDDFNNNGLINVANILNGNSYIFDTNIHSTLECNTLKDIHLTGNTERVTIKAALLGKVIVDDILLLRSGISQSGNLTAREIVVDSTYNDNLFVINGTVKAVNCKLMQLNNEPSGTLQTNNLILQQTSNNSGIINTSYLLIYNKFTNAGTINIANNINFTSNIINKGYINSEQNIVISSKCANSGTLIAHMINSATISNLLNDGIIKIKNLGDSDSEITIVNKGQVVISKDAVIQGSITIANAEIKTQGDLYIKDSRLTLKGLLVATTSTVNIDENSYALVTANLNQENLSIINHATLELSTYNKINHYDGRNSSLILTIGRELSSIVSPIISCKQHAIFNSDSKILLKPSVVLNHIEHNTITLVEAAKGIKFDVTQNAKIPELTDLSTKNLSNLVIDSIENYSLFFKIYNPQVIDANKKLICQLKLLYDLEKFSKNMMYASILLDKNLIGNCIDKTTSIFAITWVCNKTDEKINTNNLAINPLSLVLKENVIAYDCKDKTLIFSGTNEDTSVKKITATNNIATIIICSEIETNNKVIDISKTKVLELNGIKVDNIEITGVNNINVDKTAVDGMLITGRHPLKLIGGSDFHIGKNAVIKAAGNKHALHIAAKLIGNINNYGVIGSKKSGNAIYISQPILTTITNYNVISSPNIAIAVCATNTWVFNDKQLTLINNGNIDGSLLFTTANTLTNIKYVTTVDNNKTINSKNITANNSMILNINNHGLINADTININSLKNDGKISVIGNNGITINSNSSNQNVINASYCNLKNHELINEKSASVTCKHLANATIKNYGSLLVTSKLSGNISVANTLTLGSSVEQSGVLTVDNIVTNNTKIKVLGAIKVVNDIKLQQLEISSTGELYSNKGLVIENTSTNRGIVDVSYFHAKHLFVNDKTGKLNIRNGSLIVDNHSLINLGDINIKQLILSGTLTNYGKITVDNFLGHNNILLAATNSQLNANRLTDITILGSADIQVAKMISGKVNINHQLGLSGDINNIGELKVATLNTNNYKFTVASYGSVTVSSPLGLTIDDNNFANYGSINVLYKLKLQNTFTNNGVIQAYLLDGDNNRFINNNTSIYDIIKNSVVVNNGSITVNHCILGENVIDGELNIGAKVLQAGSLTISSIESGAKSEFIIDNNSNVNISNLNNNNLNITNFGNLVVNRSMVVNSYKAQGGILTIQVEPKLTGAPFLQAEQDIQINSLFGNQALITISATKGIPKLKRNKVIIATAKSLLVDNKKMLDTDLSYLLAVKKIASTSLLLNITNVGIDRNENQEAIYANLEYINIADIKQLKTAPVSIRRFASYLQNFKILQMEPYILELIRDEIKHYRLHPDTENEALYFLQEHHPRAYKSLITKIRNRLLNSIEVTKQSDDYQQVVDVINSYLHKHYQQQVIEDQTINLTATVKTHVVDGTITNNALYISDKVVQNKNIMLNNIVADTEAEFYITNNAKVKINDFNSTNISLVNSGLLEVTNNLVVNSYTSWGGCLAINVENISNKPIILVNNNVNLNDAYGNKSQLILTTSNFNKVGTVISDVLMLQAKKITLNNEVLQDTDLANILAMKPANSVLLQLSNPKQIISNNSHKILVDLSWIDAKKLLLTAEQPISLSQLAAKLQQVTDNEQQTNIIDNVNENQFKISNDLLISGTITAKQLIADKPVLFTIDNHALADIDSIDNTDINIVNNGTLNTSPGVNVCSYIANGGNLIFNINGIINKPFLQAKNNIEFNSNNNKLATITLQCTDLAITEDTQQIILAKAKNILLDGEEVLEADVNNLLKYQKVASSSILCKLDNIAITKTATDAAIQAQLSVVDITTIKAIDDKPVSVKQLAQLMQQSASINTKNTVLSFIEKQITAGEMPSDMHSIYKKFTSRTTDNSQQLNQVINNIEALHKANNSNLSASINELLPDNSCANLQSIFSISKQAVLSINNHKAIQEKFNFMANKYFSLNATAIYTMPLWFSIKQQQYSANNASNYFNAVTNSEVYSMGLEKNYNKLNIGYLLNYGVATTANSNISEYNKDINNQVTSAVSAIYTNYNISNTTSYVGFLAARNKHCYTNTNKLLNTNYNSNYNTITTAVFYNLTTSGKVNNLAFRFNSGIYFMNVNFPEYNATSIETHSSYNRKLISLYTAITFMYNINLFKNKLTQVNLSLNYSHDFNINNNNNINIRLLDHNFIISQKKINYQEFNLDAAININLTKNSNMIFNVNDSLSSNGNKFNVKIQYNYKL